MRFSARHLTFLILGGVRLAATLAPAAAQVTLPFGEIAVTAATSASAFQGSPAVAADSLGDFLVVWQQQTGATGGWDIYARQYRSSPGSPGGAVAGPPIQVTLSTSACRQAPAVAADAAGNFVVVWASNEGSGGLASIFGRLYASSGQPSAAQFAVSPPAAGDQQAPAVAMAPDGRFLVVWQADAQDGSSWGIAGQAYAAGGAPAGAGFAVNLTTAGAQHSPAVAYLPTSAAAGERFQVAWQSEGEDGAGAGTSGILARSVNAAGQALGGELAVNAPATGAHAHPRLAADPSGNFVVVWENLTGAGSAVLARRFTAAGVPLSGPLAIDPGGGATQRNPAVAADPLGNFVVSWDSLGQDGDGTAVGAQQADNRQPPRLLGNPVQLDATTAGDQGWPAISASAGGEVWTAWQSVTPAGDQSVVVARLAKVPPLAFYTVVPCRMVDTRNAAGPLGGPILTTGQARNFPLLSAACGVPPTAKALSLNATAVTPSGAGSLVLYPGDMAAPSTNTISFAAGAVVANNAALDLSRNGDGSLTVLPTLTPGGHVHFIVDVNGYFQ